MTNEEIARESAEKIDPKSDGERVTCFNIVLDAITRAQSEDKANIKAALATLKSDHVQNNSFRLGALGKSDIDMAIRILEHAARTKEQS